jgi:hypothetical protein
MGESALGGNGVSSQSTKGSANTGAIAGAIVAGVVAIAAAAGVGYYVWRKKQRSSMVKHVFNPVAGVDGISTGTARPVPENDGGAAFRKSIVRV